ncbi:M20/M25/M40 family metallo-hydrolase [Thalassoroseus pseudoceratinae]|uniref:M20/M25/M40 family metallo-hydrolase n=1 Tax=Thalassoroseus pseudoceratinae TaxID=2713176 RepID=UPI00141F0CE9|nr:M20/M25/M40 family metallo-hydrolase [Thalassoroseus pseudoceratinae]
MSRNWFRLLIGLWACLCVGQGGPSPVIAEELSATQKSLLDDLKYLASDDLDGRGVGTEGLNQAAEFVKKSFQEAGLKVDAVNGDAFQTFEITTGSKLGQPNKLTLTGPNDKTIELKLDEDFEVCSFGGSGKFDKPLVFCGYGIEHEKYNDFDGVELKDAIAIIMRRNPQQGKKGSPFAGVHGGVSRHAALSTKLSNAYQRGAAAVLFVNDPYSRASELSNLKDQLQKARAKRKELAQKIAEVSPDDEDAAKKLKQQQVDTQKQIRAVRQQIDKFDPDPLMEFGYGGDGKDKSIPVAHITQEVANRVLSASLGKTLSELETQIDEDLKPQSAILKGWKADGTVTVERVKSEIKNVIGVLEGEGPLKDETIVIGAHYDHVGMGGAGSLAPGSNEVHNGADDNASGTVALLELAERLANREEKPKRRLVFIAFTAEEIGLVGSARYCKEPVFPLKNTIAMFNMDMVGRLRDDSLTIFGTGTAKRWEKLLEPIGKDSGLKLTFKPEGFGPSDQSSFYAKKIPVLHLFTNTHRDYHRPSDDWDKINVSGIDRIVALLEKIVVATDNEPERPEYVQVKEKANPMRSGNRPYFGSIPDFANEIEGYALQGVSPGSPADKGGLKAGDVIVEFGDSKIGGLDDFDLALRKFKAGEQVAVVVIRDGKRVKLKVTLATPK